MKKSSLSLILIIIAIFAVAFSSCKKDSSQSPSKKIVGKWYVTSIITEETTNGVQRKDTVINTNLYDSYEFYADGMAFIRQSDTEQSISWKISNNKLVLGTTTAYSIAEQFDINALTNTTLQLHRFETATDWKIDQITTLSKVAPQQ